MIEASQVQRLELEFLPLLQFQYVSGEILIRTRGKSSQPRCRAFYLRAEKPLDNVALQPCAVVVIYRRVNTRTQFRKLLIGANRIQQFPVSAVVTSFGQNIIPAKATAEQLRKLGLVVNISNTDLTAGN